MTSVTEPRWLLSPSTAPATSRADFRTGCEDPRHCKVHRNNLAPLQRCFAQRCFFKTYSNLYFSKNLFKSVFLSKTCSNPYSSQNLFNSVCFSLFNSVFPSKTYSNPYSFQNLFNSVCFSKTYSDLYSLKTYSTFYLL